MCGRERYNVKANHPAAGMTVVEVIVAYVLLSVGLLAITGISLHAGAQSRLGTWQTDQALAAQQTFGRLQQGGHAAAATGTGMVTVGHRTYSIDRRVSAPVPRTKRVRLTVSSASASNAADIAPRTFETRLYGSRQLPAAP